jgi:hypothetical protein
VSDYFESIGFSLERPEFETQLQRALAEGEHLVAQHGDYHIWHIGAAELWVLMYRLGKRRELAGANPHFEGGARMSVIVESLDRNAEFPLEGEMYAWAALPGEDTDAKAHGIYPFSASLPDYDLVADSHVPPFRATLALAGFASKVDRWADEAAFSAEQRREREGIAFASQSFVPTGLFGKHVGRARSHAVVTGRVVGAQALTNGATGRSYRALRVATYGGELDVVAAEAQLPGLPDADSIVRAHCWLSGRFASFT